LREGGPVSYEARPSGCFQQPHALNPTLQTRYADAYSAAMGKNPFARKDPIVAPP